MSSGAPNVLVCAVRSPTEHLKRAEFLFSDANVVARRAPPHDRSAIAEARVGLDGGVGGAEAAFRNAEGGEARDRVALRPGSARANRVGGSAGSEKLQDQIWKTDHLGCERKDVLPELEAVVDVVHQPPDLGLHHHIEEMVVEYGAHTLEWRAPEFRRSAIPRAPVFHELVDRGQ